MEEKQRPFCEKHPASAQTCMACAMEWMEQVFKWCDKFHREPKADAHSQSSQGNSDEPR